jgi:hypothetical protein
MEFPAKEFTVVRFTAPTKESWGLTNGKVYGTDFESQESDDYFLTVWNDQGTLAEMYEDEFELVSQEDAKEWFKAIPERRFREEL